MIEVMAGLCDATRFRNVRDHRGHPLPFKLLIYLRKWTPMIFHRGPFRWPVSLWLWPCKFEAERIGGGEMDDYGFHPSAAIVCDVSSGSEGVGKIDSLGNWDERFGMREKWYERVVQTRFVWENCRYGWTLIFWK